MSDNEPRRATDVLLDIESKVNILVQLVQSLDFNFKILSNKMNDISNKLEKIANNPTPNKITVEAVNTKSIIPFHQMQTVDPERQIPISAEAGLPITDAPLGFRRTSRPETYTELGKQETIPNKPVTAPVQPSGGRIPQTPPPGRSSTESVVNAAALAKQPITQTPIKPNTLSNTTTMQNAVPVIQRVMDKTQKSIFLADVKIINVDTSEPVFKGRTNGTGKWMASLAPGSYQILVRKSEPLTKGQLETTQTINVDGKISPLELPPIILK